MLPLLGAAHVARFLACMGACAGDVAPSTVGAAHIARLFGMFGFYMQRGDVGCIRFWRYEFGIDPIFTLSSTQHRRDGFARVCCPA